MSADHAFVASDFTGNGQVLPDVGTLHLEFVAHATLGATFLHTEILGVDVNVHFTATEDHATVLAVIQAHTGVEPVFDPAVDV